MKKKISIITIILSFLIYSFIFIPKNNQVYVKTVISPTELILNSGESIKIEKVETFDTGFTQRNKDLAKRFNITEEDAFILGNLAKSWAKNILEGRKVYVNNGDIIYNKFSYSQRFWNTPFCIENGNVTNKKSFEKQLKTIRKQHFVVYDVSENMYYEPDDIRVKNLKDFLVIPKRYTKIMEAPVIRKTVPAGKYKSKIDLGNIKIIVSDNTSKIFPDRNCSDDICKEILYNFNTAQKSIDIAIYGYSTTPAIENAIKNAIKRGVKIRLIYDVDTKGENIYPNTFEFVSLIKDNKNDGNISESGSTMHNKFYIIDDRIVITGSANLSHTDMSGFNSNSIIILDLPEIANMYKTEFNQMFEGKFHNSKQKFEHAQTKNIEIYFSPQDNTIENGLIPLIQNAKKYIYIPIFIISDKQIASELINAKKRGVEIKIIVDALNASNKYSKHKEMRNEGIQVKTENYAGKMHSKTMIVDDEYLVIGSMNFSKSGNIKNDENMVILRNSQAAKFYKTFFLYQWERIPEKWLKYDAKAESKDSIGSCSDGIDNNYNGLIDLDDNLCK